MAALAGAAAPRAAGDIAAAPVAHSEKAWEFFRSIGSPKFHVAPMVDQSELPFRRLCRKYGATCAYTPMFHARLFCEDPKYRSEIFTTNESDRPLLVQFCANDPNFLVRAANLAAPHADAIDINFGCPQRIASRGNYGAFLMDDLKLIERLVTSLVKGVNIPVTCKIRVFPKLEDTLAYARMIERCGCSVLAVHGRTRQQKDNTATRADWSQIKAVKEALHIPVLANGNIRHLQDALDCLAFTGADGVLSAESLLQDPALFSPSRLEPGGAYRSLDGIRLCLEYLELCRESPTHLRMVKGHMHKLLGPWLAEYTDLRETINRGKGGLESVLEIVRELDARVQASGRDEPVPTLSTRALERIAKEEARKAAIEEQERESSALGAIESGTTVQKGPDDGAAVAITNQVQPGTAQDPPLDAAGEPDGNGVDVQGVSKKRKGDTGAVVFSDALVPPVACEDCY